ncbi:MAG: cation-translocating P-type ATPase [Elusimicrobia bacterium]|nr:cation-translocating P-type ATPase [Elusimicrobiota bacterium]
MGEIDKKEKYYIEGMHCAACAVNIEKSVKKVEGIKDAQVSFASGILNVTYEKDLPDNKVLKKVEELGYGIKKHKIEIEEGIHKYDIIRLIIVGFLVILGHLLHFTHSKLNYIFLATTIWCGWPFFRAIYSSIRNRFVDADAFMGLGILGTLVIGEFMAGTIMGLLVLVSRLLEDYTTAKSKSAIQSMIKAAPKTAQVLKDGIEIEADVKDVKLKDIIVVKTGEKIPVDGKVVNGSASVNQAMITGESISVEKNINDIIYAGTIVDSGFLQIETERIGEDSTYGKIIKLIEEAQSSKAPIQKIADVFTNYFTPVVLIIIILTFLVTRNFKIAITVLVVACPCAVALATPLAFVAAIGKASRRGILIKGGIYLENLSKAKTIVFDKTGTLTIGEPKVVEIKRYGVHNETEVVECAAIAEKFSGHPLSKAILRKAEELKINIPDPKQFYVIKGKGVIAEYSGRKIILGSRELLKDEKVNFPSEINEYMEKLEIEGKTPLVVAHDNEVCGVITVADVIRHNARETIFELRENGIKNLIMLTGDNDRTGKMIGETLGMDTVYTEMLPEEKIEQIKKLLSKDDKIVMVGDGVNDAPALTQADVGIAMAAMGTDVAIESSDIALMNDDLSRIPEVILLGRRTFQTIKQNITLGIIFNVVGMGLAAAGILSPTGAAIAHVLPDFIVFLNSAKLFK